MQMTEKHVEEIEMAADGCRKRAAKLRDAGDATMACRMEEVAARLAEVAEHLQAQGWRTMESAPKDGREVLLYFPEVMGRFGKPSHSPMIRAERYPVGYPRQPTHWQPLPAPPSHAASEE